MKRVLLFGGTSEGRLIAGILSENEIFCDLCVATEYGSMVMDELPFVTVHTGRLSEKDIEGVIEKGCYDAVIDATHPFALEVSKNIRSSTEGKVPLIRFERNRNESSYDGCIYEEDSKQCAADLEKTEGRILLTTGSKELSFFSEKESLRKRLVVRVLPGQESLRLCYEAGLEGKQIIAMQGPFSEKMNRLLIEEYGISALVMKESGKAGGTDEKIKAARATGIPCYVIRRPEAPSATAFGELSDTGAACGASDFFLVSDYDSLRLVLEKILATRLSARPFLRVSLVGIGPGALESMTLAVRQRLSEADCVFGAPRMLESAGVKGPSYPFYLASDIIPRIEELRKDKAGPIRVVVLFSGDPGFFSGAEKLRKSLSALPFIEVEVLPGISSLQYLASKFSLSWQNWAIMSMHGTPEAEWLPLFESYVKAGRDVYFISSGAADIRRLGEVSLRFMKAGLMKSCKVFLGYQLSYPDERIKILRAEECLEEDGKGLYSGILVPQME